MIWDLALRLPAFTVIELAVEPWLSVNCVAQKTSWVFLVKDCKIKLARFGGCFAMQRCSFQRYLLE